MLKREDGFSLIELMVAMVIFIAVIAASSNIFLKLFSQLKQQSKITETTLQDVIGLEIMRRDIESAGYGLPWNIPAGVSYSGSTLAPIGVAAADSAPNAPRGLVSGNNLGAVLPLQVVGADYLVVKSINATSSNVGQNWALLSDAGVLRNGVSGQSFLPSDLVIVMNPGARASVQKRSLVVNAVGSYFTTYNSTAGFQPTKPTETYVIYGLDPTRVGRPFNRADFYISANNVPARCAPGTGVLVKAVVQQDQFGSLNEFPLLDCVADMQVVYAMDMDQDGDFQLGGGSPDVYTNTLAGLSALQVRSQVKQVNVQILAQEGRMDPNYTNLNTTVTVGQFGLGRSFDLTTITNGLNYRWKVHTLAVHTDNMQG